MSGRRPSFEEEFADFATARAPQLYRSAWLLCGDHHLAEDLVQETLANLYARWRKPLGGRIDNPAAYAQTTLTRVFLSNRRRRSSSEQPFAEFPQGHVPEAPDAGERAADRVLLREALGELADADRAVLVLRYLEDLSVAETADRMGVSPGAVRSRSMRALERVRSLLEPSPGTPSTAEGTA